MTDAPATSPIGIGTDRCSVMHAIEMNAQGRHRIILQHESGAISLAIAEASDRAAGYENIKSELTMTPAEIGNLAILLLAGPSNEQERRFLTTPGISRMLAAALILQARRLGKEKEKPA